mmetsp:Transcript_26516/g.50904  ORF Transcript_26516/g.50904 Transcript_26516/m.50904 type:complete len:797 (+) Transcript_26516:57-2447(+)
MYQRLADGGSIGGRWDAAPDLEQFLTSFYQYFEARGYRGAVARHLSHLAALAFTIGFSFALLFFVDWGAILSCKSEEACRSVSLCYERPFHQMGLWRCGVLFCFFLFSAYWVFNIVAAYHCIQDAGEMSIYYRERLGIASDDALSTMLWSEVVSRLVQQQRASPFCIVQDELTVLEIANIIMREDNFMIALTNHHAFTSRLPPWIPPRLAYTRAVLWSVRTATFRWVFNHRSRLCGEFLNRPAALAKRLKWIGVLNLLLMVPVLMFVTIYFFMRHAEEFRSHRASPFRRQWTEYAKWTFREFNELPHQFSARMNNAHTMAEDYVQSSKSSFPVMESLQRFVKFVAGSILAVLLIIAFWDDTPLLFVKIQDKNLLWYLAFFGFLFALADNAGAEEGTSSVTRSSRQTPTPGTPLRMHVAMMRLVKCTHFLPPSWRSPAPMQVLRGDCGGAQRAELCKHFQRVRSEFLRHFFVHRIQSLAEELLSVILAPLLLIVYLPEAAPDIVAIVREARHSSPNLGDWCAFGCLDPSRNGSDAYGANNHGDAAAAPPAEGYTAIAMNSHGGFTESCASTEGNITSFGGKLEKSAISFILHHRVLWSWHDQDQGPQGAKAWMPRTGFHLRGFSNATRVPDTDLSIPLQELATSSRSDPEAGEAGFGASASSAGAAVPPRGGTAVEADDARIHVWGYPPCALRLLRNLEEFRDRHARLHREFCEALPDELFRLDRVLLEKDVGHNPLEEEELERGSCSAHFFWLEVLADCQQEQQQSAQLGGQPSTREDCEVAVFETFDREHTAVHG